jgi:hypothetical protein
MYSILENYKKNKVFYWFTLCLFVVIILLEIKNNRFEMSDFKVYYLAGKAFFSGNPIYGMNFGLTSGYYKYSPVFILLFSPYLLFGYKTACIIHGIMLSIATIISIVTVKNILQNTILHQEIKHKYLLLFLILITVNHLFREIHLGNVNMFIVMLLCLGIQKTIEEKYLLSGVFIALAIFIKPYLVVLALPLFFHKKTKTFWSLIIWSGLLFMLPIVYLGINNFIQLNKQWIHEIFQHGAYLYSNHTFTSLVRRYITLRVNDHSHLYFLITFIFSYTLIYFISLKKYSALSENNNNKSLVFSYFIILAILPNILITDTEHFLYSTPIILFSIYYLYLNNHLKYTIVFGIFSILYGINSTDILGRELSGKFENYGILGLANLGIIITFLLLQRNQKKVDSISTQDLHKIQDEF